MLERTPVCLESGFRLSLRSQRRVPRSRRLLHSAFWTHGAGDLDLPPWALQSPPPPPKARDSSCCVSDETTPRASTTHTQMTDGPFLDFLYPPQALAFMNASSQYSERRDRRQIFQTSASGARGYASLSSTASTRQEEATTNNSRTVQGSGDALSAFENEVQSTSSAKSKRRVATLPSLDSLEELKHIMRTEKGGEAAGRAWGLFYALDSTASSDLDLRRSVLIWLSKQNDVRASNHTLQLFDVLQNSERTFQTYHAAVAACILVNRMAKARKIHEEACKSTVEDYGSCGSSLLMRAAVKAGDWDLGKEVLRLYRRYRKRISMEINIPFIFRDLDFDPDYRIGDRVADLAVMLKTSLSSRPSESGVLTDLLEQIIRRFTLHFCHLRNETDTYYARQLLRDWFTLITYAEVGTPALYETCILQLNNIKHDTRSDLHYRMLSYIFQRYRRRKDFQPSKQVLHSMMLGWRRRRLASEDDAIKESDEMKEITLLRYWDRYHGKLDEAMLILLMDLHSRLGDVSRVVQYADDLKELKGQDMTDAAPLWPLINVHAIRRDPKAAREQFEQMEGRYGVRPDVRCCNILLYAYERTDDLEGALEAVHQMRAKGFVLDEYSFGPLLAMCGKLGDVDGAHELLRITAELGIQSSTTMMNGLIVAYTNSGQLTEAENTLETVMQSITDGKMKGSPTICYNTVMTAYALQKDTQSTSRLYEQMKRQDIQVDSNTYAALLQALCGIRKTNQAYKILRDVMPKQGIRSLSLHYAIVMGGYLNQDMPAEALVAHRNMKETNVKESPSTRMVYLNAKAIVENRNRKQTDMGKSEEPTSLSATIRDLIEGLGDEERLYFQTDVQRGIHDDSRNGISAAYFVQLITIHGANQCYEAATKIFQTWCEKNSVDSMDERSLPIRLVSALMFVQLRMGNFEIVERYWTMVVKEAQSLRLKIPQSMRPAKGPLSGKDLATMSLSDLNQAAPRIAKSFHDTLSRPARYYFHALASMKQPRVTDMISTFASLISKGFTLDNTTWNVFIKLLCKASPPRTLLAFTLVERSMIGAFPGWRTPRSSIKIDGSVTGFFAHKAAKDLGTLYMRYVRHQHGELYPTYETFVYLANALLQLRRREAIGIDRSDRSKEANEVRAQLGQMSTLRKQAPKTLQAVQNMPTVYDTLQSSLIRGLAGDDGSGLE